MKRKIGISLLLMVAVCFTIMAGGQKEATEGKGISGTIRLWTHIEPAHGSGRANSHKVLIDEFEKENPAAKVVVEVQPWVEMTGKFMAAHAAGNPPDVSLIHSSAVDQAINLGCLADLNVWIKSWPKEEVEDFYVKPLWNRSIKGDKKYLFQIMDLAEITIYRIDLFKKYGVDPKTMKDWNGFIEAATLLTRDKAGNTPKSSSFNPDQIDHWGYGRWLARASGAFVMVDMLMFVMDGSRALNSDWTANWTSPTGVKAFTLWTDLMTKYRVESKRDLMADLSTSDSYFASGSEAIHHLASFRVDGVQKNATFDRNQIGSMPYPGVNGKQGSVELGSWFVGMAELSKNKQTAWKLLEKLVSKKGDLQWVKDTPGILPSRASTTKDPWYSTDEAAFVRSIADAAKVKSHLVLLPPVDYRDDLVIAQHAVVAGTPIEKALKDAADGFNKRLAEALKK